MGYALRGLPPREGHPNTNRKEQAATVVHSRDHAIPATSPGSKFSRQGGSKFDRRGHIQELLSISHRWGEAGPQARTPRFGAVLYYVGKNSQQYKKGRHLAAQFIPFADRTVETSLKNIRKIVDATKFELLVKKVRVVDSAKDGAPNPELVGTEDEESVSGSEQFTYCVACVLNQLDSGSPG